MLELDDNKRKWLLVASGVLCFIAAFSIIISFKGKFGPDTPPRPIAAGQMDKFSSESGKFGGRDEEGTVWVVYVTGAVMIPGVYEVKAGSRVDDALKAAGGFSVHADPEAVNLAARISDGVHIKFPERGAQDAGNDTHALPATAAVAQITPGILPPSSPGLQDEPLIDLNSATHGELCTLPGIGPKLAQAIIEHRESSGPFEAVEDLCLVKGIGTKRLEQIRGLVSAGR